MKKIIYPNKNGSISVMSPSGELSDEETAKKDVPTGVKYKIIDASDLPDDYEFFNAWEYNFDKNGHDGVGE